MIQKVESRGSGLSFMKVLKRKGMTGTFENDIPIGKFTYYYLTGEVSAVTDFIKDDNDGIYPNVSFERKGDGSRKIFTDQEKDSTWLSFNDRKEIMSKENYRSRKTKWRKHRLLP